MDKPYAWQPTIIDVQMLKLGQLIILAVPGEFTTMAGRRIKDAVQKEAEKNGVKNAKVGIITWQMRCGWVLQFCRFMPATLNWVYDNMRNFACIFKLASLFKELQL